MTVHQVELQHAAATPWRNGGGLTRDLLFWPSAAEWQVRVSVATIDRSGPFSAFPGVTRWFNVLSGDGVVLRFPNAQHTMRVGDEPLCFDGADAPGCELLGSATQDLNLMAPSHAGMLSMHSAAVNSEMTGGHWCGLYVRTGATVRVDGQDHTAPENSLLWSSSAKHWHLTHTNQAAWWLSLRP